MSCLVQLPSGKWRCIIRKRGVTESKSFATKSEAKRYGAAREAAIEAREIGLVMPKTATVGDLLTAYEREVGAKSKSAATVYGLIRKSRLGSVRIRDLSAPVMDAWAADVMTNATAETVRVYLAMLYTVGRWARAVKRIDWPDGLCRDAISRLKFNGHKLGTNARNRLASKDELATLFAHWAAKPSHFPMTEIVTFAVETCFRVSEICSIVARDYDPQGRTQWVRNRKNGCDLEAPLSPEAVSILEARMAAGFTDRPFPYESKKVSEAFSAACRACEIENLRFHDLRHTGITSYARKGLKLQELRLISGHNGVGSLMRYVNLRPADIHDRLAQLEQERQMLFRSLAAE